MDSDFNFNDNGTTDSAEISGNYYDDKDLEKNALMEKYDNINYTEAERVNLIKKIELYLTDPDLKKITNTKYHLQEYIGKQSNRKNLNNLDAKTLNYIYDELRDMNMNEGINDMAFKTYLTVNQLMETIIIKTSNNKIDVEGYSDALDNNINKMLMKQITVDNFDYFTGRISPQYLLLFNTMNTMTATYSRNKRKKKNNDAQDSTQQPKQQPTQQHEQLPEKQHEPQIKNENDDKMDAIKKFINNNSLPLK